MAFPSHDGPFMAWCNSSARDCSCGHTEIFIKIASWSMSYFFPLANLSRVDPM